MRPDLPKSCLCGSGKPRRALTDAAGIFCCFVCDDCETEKRRAYRPEIFSDPNYESTEPKFDDG